MDFNALNLETWQLVVMLIVGVGLMFAGYRIKKVAFFLIWFVLGYALVGHLMPMINGAFAAIASSSLWQWLLPLCGGLLLALLGFSIEKLCVGGICFGLVMAVTINYFGTEMQTLAIGGVVGVIAAGAAVMLMKPATLIATSVAGAYLATVAAVLLWPQIDAATWYWPLLVGLSAIGSVAQFITTKHVN